MQAARRAAQHRDAELRLDPGDCRADLGGSNTKSSSCGPKAPLAEDHEKDGEIIEYDITPEDLGIKSQTLVGLSVDTAEDSLNLIKAAFGRGHDDMAEKARDLIRHHEERGDTLLIITATNGFVTYPVADRLGIAHIIAPHPEVIDGKYTGKTVGIPSFQEGKVTRLNDWLAAHGESLEGAWFYSDSHNDLPLLEKVANPVAVDPDPKLEKYARSQGWSVMTLRD